MPSQSGIQNFFQNMMGTQGSPWQLGWNPAMAPPARGSTAALQTWVVPNQSDVCRRHANFNERNPGQSGY